MYQKLELGIDLKALSVSIGATFRNGIFELRLPKPVALWETMCRTVCVTACELTTTKFAHFTHFVLQSVVFDLPSEMDDLIKVLCFFFSY